MFTARYGLRSLNVVRVTFLLYRLNKLFQNTLVTSPCLQINQTYILTIFFSKFFLLLHFHLRLNPPNNLCPSGFLTNTTLQCYKIRKRKQSFLRRFHPVAGFEKSVSVYRVCL